MADEIRRITTFLAILVNEETIAAIVPAVSLTAMRGNVAQIIAEVAEVWKGGAATFFFKGTNGRWKEVLSAKEVALYEARHAGADTCVLCLARTRSHGFSLVFATLK